MIDDQMKKCVPEFKASLITKVNYNNTDITDQIY